jgi:GDP-4-dehydro-6-deoxy-D-mannose reductase
VRAFVTGAGGFVGSWLVEHLRACGDEVVVTDREVDVTDSAAVRNAVAEAKPDAVYHLAALTHVGRSYEDPAPVVTVNTLGTLSVLEAARACEHKPRVLVVSSAEVYGAVTPADLPLQEESPLAPVSPYAASKVAAEFLGVQAHLAHGLEVIRVRPFNHVGPGQSTHFAVPALASRIVSAIGDGESWIPVGNLAAKRDLTDVRDVVRAYRLLVCDGVPGSVYNVCSGKAVAIQEVTARLLELSGADLELRPDPALVRPIDVPVLEGDPGKLEKQTGWRPETALDRTLSDVLADVGFKAPLS